MRAKQFFISTQKEAPADAEIVSQKLMLRAGMIRKLAAGVYNYMPMGLRSLKKIERIVREEMDRAGAIELLMPIVQPAELWQETGRWQKYGSELLRFKDRHDRDFVLQPTSEEVVTDIARQEIKSWRQLPVNFYQIQTKFRDERRPRFGVMRGRDFVMKDAYSFDRTAEDAGKSYDKMFEAYCRIFDRLGLVYRAVRADSGSIGGSRSQEFQIQTKFRDERRPRFGVMRGRDFVMKDAYSFDRTAEDAGKSYDKMFEAYCRIFDRLGLVYRAVRADSGSIGGSRSQEFQVIADTGEDLIVFCPDSEYAANIELAEAPCLIEKRAEATETMEKVPTPGRDKCELVVELLNKPLTASVKSIVLAVDHQDEKGNPLPAKIVLLLLRGDHTLNEVKAEKLEALKGGFRFATDKEIEDTFGSKPGYLGPVGIPKDVTIVADTTVANMSDFIVGANEEGYHIRGVNWGRDLREPDVVADIRNVVEGDVSPDGKGTLKMQRGIEVGHVFFLGDKYSAPMNATYLDENGKPQLLQMGCYGIGISRLLGAAIEQGHDDKGIIWPDSIAPFTVVICPVGYDKSEEVQKASNELYGRLREAGIDVILDDRGLRPGVMFADWELIGVPHRVTIGDRGLKNGEVEYAHRGDLQNENVPVTEIADKLIAKIKVR